MFFALVPVVLALVVTPGTAGASDETATSSLRMTPATGQFSRTQPVPVNWEVDVEVKAPYPSSPKVTPVKEIHASLPKDMSFNPDPKMKVCPDSAIGPGRDLTITPDSAITLCPDSVIGNGTAEHYIAGNNSPAGPNLTDGVVVIFNGGRTRAGLPRIKIYGYSSGAATGIYMEGVLRQDGKLDVSIPVLPFDSATGKFHLEIPGSKAANRNRRGQDPKYVRAACSTGTWEGQVSFLLGRRDSAGKPGGPESTISAPPFETFCRTGPGPARLGKLKAEGPSAVVAGRKATYGVTIRNIGGSVARFKATGDGVRPLTLVKKVKVS
ncbi:MAG: hypothetical protein ACSLFD_10155 [Solirubrobacterales bacterium]